MQPDERDAGYLWDMLDAPRSVVEFTEGIRYEEYLKDRMRQFAAERAIGIIGEAAGRLQEPVRVVSPDIEWRKIVGLRNILIHEYFGVSLPLVWDVIQSKLDPSESSCRELLNQLPNS